MLAIAFSLGNTPIFDVFKAIHADLWLQKWKSATNWKFSSYRVGNEKRDDNVNLLKSGVKCL